MAGAVRTSKVGTYTEIGQPDVIVSKVVTYTEIGQPSVIVSNVGVYTEYGLPDVVPTVYATQLLVDVEFIPNAEELSVTEFGVLVEVSNDKTHVTQFGVLLELEELDEPIMATYYERKPVEIDYVQLPEATVGYQLDAGNSFWSVIVPEASVNLFTNPSYELPFSDAMFDLDRNEISGWNTYERSHVYATRGFYGLLCYPDGASEGLVAQTFIPPAAGWYTFSVDLWAKANAEYRLEANLVSSTIEGDLLRRVFIKPKTTGTQRYSISFYVPTSGVGVNKTVKCKLVSASTNTVNQFCSTDGWQVEQKAYATTYFDGSTLDDSFVGDPDAYSWEGHPHLSPSRRNNTVYNGGRIVSLYDSKFKTTSIQGLGYVSPEANVEALSNGAGYLSSLKETFREFSIVGKIYGCDLKHVPRAKQQLIDLFNHALRRSGQVVLRYQPVDRYGLHFGKPISIPCVYQGGLEGNVVDNFSEQVELRFKTVSGKVYEEFDKTEELSISQNVLDNSFILRNPITGEYKRLITSMTGNGIYCSTVLPNGNIVVGGDFSALNGVTSLYNVALWDWETEEWGQVDEYGFDEDVYALASTLNEDGDIVIIAGGAFTVDGATGTTATYRHIAQVTLGSTWEEVGSGLDDVVYEVTASYLNDRIYLGGYFTEDNDANPLSKFCSYVLSDTPIGSATFTSYSPVFDAGDTIYSIWEKLNGNVILAGSFDGIDSDTDYQSIAEFSPANDELVDSYGTEEVLGSIYKVVEDRYGTVYICGTATKADGAGLAYWTGSSWVDALAGYADLSDNPRVFSFDFDEHNNIHMLLYHQTDEFLWYMSAEIRGNVLVQSHMRVYNVVDPTLPANGYRKKVIFDRNTKQLMFCLGGFNWSLLVPSSTTITSVGTAPSHCDVLLVDENTPQATIPQLVRVTNWSAGVDLFFDTKNHVAVSDLRYVLSGYKPQLFVSRDRRQLETVLLGSSTSNNLTVLPGDNHIQVLNYLTGGSNDAIYLKYRPAHWSIDAATS